jgi:hypothetical protein
MKMKQLWLFRICLYLALLVAANRIFAFSDTNNKAKYTLQAQTTDQEDEVDVLIPALTPIWEFSKMVSANPATLATYVPREASGSIPRFIRFRNLRL